MKHDGLSVEILLFLVIVIALMLIFKEPLIELLNYLLETTYQRAITI